MWSPSSSFSVAILSRSRANENESSVLAHLAHPHADRGGAAQRLFGALRGGHKRYQIVLCGGQQLLPLALPLLGKHRIATHEWLQACGYFKGRVADQLDESEQRGVVR